MKWTVNTSSVLLAVVFGLYGCLTAHYSETFAFWMGYFAVLSAASCVVTFPLMYLTKYIIAGIKNE